MGAPAVTSCVWPTANVGVFPQDSLSTILCPPFGGATAGVVQILGDGTGLSRGDPTEWPPPRVGRPLRPAGTLSCIQLRSTDRGNWSRWDMGEKRSRDLLQSEACFAVIRPALRLALSSARIFVRWPKPVHESLPLND